ncbi:hypothetical protein [Rhodothermus profundi]|uniref:Porin n=1 Tax=Rhodothermus profundi TaxID=633813 RepID=A0A1M6P4T0_9BACT|nr:hypothetical protein [Rhodothermus profundi]SHK02938.1 hypothetical protein SAMN04488087_0031 [Rhodothermus profundi]
MRRFKHRTPGRSRGFSLLLVFLATPLTLWAQSFKLSGFIKAEYLYDTRQVAAAREGEFHLFPLPRSEATETDNFGAFVFFSRLRLNIGELPQALGAQVTGYFEADFFGPNNGLESTFRLRRGFVRLIWDQAELLFGQEWSPLFTLAAFPRTVATTTGAPFQPFARQPQIRATLKGQGVRFIGALAWQRDAFRDISFNGISGVKQQQMAALPAVHAHLQLLGQRGSVIGAGTYLKSLRPVATGDRFFAWAAQAYFTLAGKNAMLRGKVTYGGDLTDHLMTGGYVYAPSAQRQGDYYAGAFKPLQVLSGWIDIDGTGQVAPGLFVGYLVNQGANGDLDGPVMATAVRGPNIKQLWRLAPRLNLNHGAVRFAFELEITSAAYARRFDARYKPIGDTETVTNVRGNFTVFLFF